MALKLTPQSYPRIDNEEDRYFGFIDESALISHSYRIPEEQLKQIIENAIVYANKKSSRVILNIPEGASLEDIENIYKKEGRNLFNYFIKYCGDPASSAHGCIGRHYSEIAKEQFRNRTLQKERMNSGWRYQNIAKDAAIRSRRFISVSDIGTNEADFNAIIKTKKSNAHISIYVSVKNRTNTMGGQDWPKAIYALENMAKNDKNRQGAYLCVFGIAMEHGLRSIKSENKTKIPYSFNTEIWCSDFFWPFFSNYSYEEIIKNVLDVLIASEKPGNYDIEIPEELVMSFGDMCRSFNLIDEHGFFFDPYRLVSLFCGTLK